MKKCNHAKYAIINWKKFTELNLGENIVTIEYSKLWWMLSLNTSEPKQNRIKTECPEYYFMIKDLIKVEKDFMYQTKIKAKWVKHLGIYKESLN